MAKKQQTNKDEMKTTVAELRAEIAKLSMENKKRQLKQTTQLRTKKDELARLLTKINMAKFAVEPAAKEESK